MSVASAATATSVLSKRYLNEAGRWDEVLEPSGDVREIWQPLLDRLQLRGPSGLLADAQEGARLFRENGMSYMYDRVGSGEPDPGERGWRLDPVPLLLSKGDWQKIEAGLKQRARLFEAILQDLHGPGRLLSSGHLSGDLVFNMERFLRPLVDSDQRDATSARPFLSFYAVDLVRCEDGAFRVLQDLTDVPTGAGQALETRLVTSRIQRELIREQPVQRLAQFFRGFRAALVEDAPHQKADPRIVLLSRGADSDTYFDDAFFANYLGVQLVEGDDLTVRDNRLWLRTIQGLQLVDTVVRRVPDRDCDTLELRPDSEFGIPGLVEVARAGNVQLVNGLGTGVVEQPALAALVGQLSSHVLGESLRLDNTETLWCGDPVQCEAALERLETLQVTLLDQPGISLDGRTLDRRELDALRQRIRAEPTRHLLRAPLPRTTAPCLSRRQLLPRTVVTRCFVARTEHGFEVMPGAFTRLAQPDPNEPEFRVCKDTWVLADESERHLIVWPTRERAPEPLLESLSSRVAEQLFWVGRRAARLEQMARLLRVALVKSNEVQDYADPVDTDVLGQLLDIVRSLLGDADAGARVIAGPQAVDFASLIHDASLRGSVAWELGQLENAAVQVRDRWTADTWRVIDDLRQALDDGRDSATPRTLENLLDNLITTMLGFWGLVHESFSHGNGTRFLSIGKHLERALTLTQMLEHVVELPQEDSRREQFLETLLISYDSIITHRRRYRNYLGIDAFVDLIILDRGNPRSLMSQLDVLSYRFAELPRDRQTRSAVLPPEERALLRATTPWRLADPDRLLEVEAGRLEGLEPALATCADALTDVDEALSARYFTHVARGVQLGGGMLAEPAPAGDIELLPGGDEPVGD